MKAQDVLDNEDQPKSKEERAQMISRCVELIERTNAAIDRHKEHSGESSLIVKQYIELREQYVNELAELLHGLRIEGRLFIREAA